MLPDLHIEPVQGKKGRTFSASLLAYVTADALWEGGEKGDGVRPVFMMVAASEGQAGPFVANLRLGRKAIIGEQQSYSRSKKPTLECLKSAGYSFSSQRHPEGVVVTAYLPGLIHTDPGMVDPTGIRFVCLPPASGIFEDALKLIDTSEDSERKPSQEDARTMLKAAKMFAVYLDRRTRAPLVPHPRFHVRLLKACLDEKLAFLSSSSPSYMRASWGRSSSVGFEEHGTSDVGLSPGIVFQATHAAFESLLADVVSDHFKAEGA